MTSISFGTAERHDELATCGYRVLRQAVPREAVDSALRLLHLDLIRRGAPADELGRWLWSVHWFPHLKWEPEIAGLAGWLPPELRDGELADPQIVLQPPDDCGEQELVPHVDQEPEWAAGRRFLRIVGFALTPSTASNGGLRVWPLGGDAPRALHLEPGDAVVMHPDLPHSSGLNREGTIRYAVYLRFLAPAG